MSVATAAGVGMSIVATEHFFSTFLSSPWTTEKFVEDEEDKAKVRRLYILAALASLAAATVIALLVKEPWPVYAAIAVIVLYLFVYERAMSEGV